MKNVWFPITQQKIYKRLKSQKTKNDMELMTAIEQTLLDMGIGYDEINYYCNYFNQDN